MLIVKGNYQYEGGYRAARQLLLMKQPPTGIFACNDLMAVGAMRAAQELGQQIPIDLSVVGYDDIQLASFTTPPLTTISQPRYDIGVIAATMLLERMHDWDLPPRRRVVDIDLQIRQSTLVRAAMIQESMS
jgi:DNA-binding LacI/PurR family transcriptional regulator